MLVCHCNVVYDRDIRAAIAAGARDEFDIAEDCGAGTRCGGCVPSVQRVLAEELCAPGCPVAATLGRSARAATVGSSARAGTVGTSTAAATRASSTQAALPAAAD